MKINNLHVTAEDIEILRGLDLELTSGDIHVLMGPNGSGKSTLAQVLMGNEQYVVTAGEVSFGKESMLDLEPNERSLKGIFLSFQYPSDVTGVTVSSFLRMIYNKHHKEDLSPVKFRKLLNEKMKLLELDEELSGRYLNEGFSGGEKKKLEMLQMLLLEPKLAIIDEVDSGLDIDALKVVTNSINYLKEKGTTFLVITHYTRILNYVDPSQVFIIKDGKIVESGGKKLAHDLEEQGYEPFGE